MIRPNVNVYKLWNGAAIDKNGSITSGPIDLRFIGAAGYFALHLITAGTGTTTITYSVAPELAGTYITPAAAVDIETALAVGSYHISFSPLVTPFIKIIITEDNVNSITSVQAWFIVK